MGLEKELQQRLPKIKLSDNSLLPETIFELAEIEFLHPMTDRPIKRLRYVVGIVENEGNVPVKSALISRSIAFDKDGITFATPDLGQFHGGDYGDCIVLYENKARNTVPAGKILNYKPLKIIGP
ncbi:MAG: hypothetical protein AABW50_03210 [Nanoarchaeota archaeon]